MYFLLVFALFSSSFADVVVLDKNNITVDIFADLPANFGTAPDGLVGCIIVADPPEACSEISPPPTGPPVCGSNLWFVLVRRFGCSFVDKVRAAQLAGYNGTIIYNVGSNVLEPMAGQDSDDIEIAAVFVGQDDGVLISSHYQYANGFKLVLTSELPFNINSYLLPFAIVVAICFLVMLIFMVVKCVKDRRRMQRYRLPSSALKKIPTEKFKKGENSYDTCAICLEDYVDDDRLRVLPCSHAYHCKCIDPWLTRNRRICPVCKRRVLARGEHFSDSESETEDETRPLLRPGSYGTQGGTFTNAVVEALVAPVEQRQEVSDDTVVHVEHSSPTSSSTGMFEDCIDVESMMEVNVVGDDSEETQATQYYSDLETPPTPAPVDTSIYFSPRHVESDSFNA